MSEFCKKECDNKRGKDCQLPRILDVLNIGLLRAVVPTPMGVAQAFSDERIALAMRLEDQQHQDVDACIIKHQSLQGSN